MGRMTTGDTGMDGRQWKRKIKKSCEAAGTYRPFFDSVIETLAGILEKRDAAQELYDSEGAEAVIDYTNKGGSTNPTQNPSLRLINELNRDALAYWRELGLTPSSLRKLNEDAMRQRKTGTLAATLMEISKNGAAV